MDKPIANQSTAAPPPTLIAKAQFGHYVITALGAVVIGLLLPIALVALRLTGKPQYHDGLNFSMQEAFFGAVILCGPGAIVLSLGMFILFLSPARRLTQVETLRLGMLTGVVMAFLNIPGFFARIILEHDTHSMERVVLLFIVAGASCGLWVSWQAWRATHPQERFLPRFSLRTLVLLVLLWGCALLAFQPRDWPEPEKPTHGER